MATRKSLSNLQIKRTDNELQKATSEVNKTPTKTSAARGGRKPIQAWVSEETHKQLRFLAVELDTTVNKLLIDGINTVFSQNKKPEIAE